MWVYLDGMRAPGMQVLTNQIKAKRPGVIIYGIGDEDHQQHTSGHNEDDTPGVSAEDQDADSIPEHRAIDVMLGPSFSVSDANKLVNDLVGNAANRVRMLYVNWGNTQWARSSSWQPRDNSDDPHGHVHISGEADADANINPWILSSWDNEPQPVPIVKVEKMFLSMDEDGIVYGSDSDLIFRRVVAPNIQDWAIQSALPHLDWRGVVKLWVPSPDQPEEQNALAVPTAVGSTVYIWKTTGDHFGKLLQDFGPGTLLPHTHTFDPAAGQSGPAEPA